MALTPKQETFCREYLIDLNGTQAAIRAGYSEKTANEQASRLLADVNIREIIQNSMDARAEVTLITAEDVLKDILETRKAAAADGKHSDRLKANELLGKHLKLFTDKVEHSGSIGLGDILKDIDGKSADLPKD